MSIICKIILDIYKERGMIYVINAMKRRVHNVGIQREFRLVKETIDTLSNMVLELRSEGNLSYDVCKR